MLSAPKDRKVNTNKPVRQDPDRRLPHERDESPQAADDRPRGVMRQAADDLAQGLVDTDLHNTPGVEQTVEPAEPPGKARPHEHAADGMRGQSPNVTRTRP